MPGSRARRRERGAALPLFVFAFIPLIGLFYVVHGAGWKVTNRVIVQNVADRAALSGAVVTSHALNELAFLDSVRVGIGSVRGVMGGVETGWQAVLAIAIPACAAEMAARNPNGYHCRLLRAMADVSPTVTDGIASDRQATNELERAADDLAELIVDEAPDWARRAAEDIAHENGAAVVKADVAFPYTQQTKNIGMRARPRASKFYDRHIRPIDYMTFRSRLPRPIYPTSVVTATLGQTAQQTVPLYGRGTARQRSANAVTVSVARASDDRDIRGRMVAAGVDATDDHAFGSRMNLDVAVARAEPYFADKSGKPDGRPAWSARLRPLTLPGDTADTGFAVAARRVGGARAMGGWLGGDVERPAPVQ